MMTRVTISEVPPRSKKLSVAPTLSSARTSPKIRQNSSSAELAGATYSRSLAWMTGAGRAFRFTFWFWFSGMLSICIVAAGIMYGGFLSPIKALSALMSTFSSLTM